MSDSSWFHYLIEKRYFTSRWVPNFPNAREHSFYIKAKFLPRDVPHGCNPRQQNINKKAYRPVRESFLETGTPAFFHLKNRGITVLADQVAWEDHGDDWATLHVLIPQKLGNVDGHHSSMIVSTLADKNQDQMIGVRILCQLPEEIINPVAEALNTSVQVTKDSLSNQRGWFDDIKRVLAGKEYCDWIGFVENQPDTSVSIKAVLSLLWVCNPVLCNTDPNSINKKHPGWIYTRAQAVFENGFHSNEETRSQMLSMTPLLPLIIDLYKYINEETPKMATKSRKSRSKIKEASGETKQEANISSLCVKSKMLAFRDPNLKNGPFAHLREPYLMMFLSGLRSLIKYDEPSKTFVWASSESSIWEIVQNAHKRILTRIIRQYSHDKYNHDITTRQPSLWESIELEVRSEALSVVKKTTTSSNQSLPTTVVRQVPKLPSWRNRT